jgi:hypothetical protein
VNPLVLGPTGMVGDAIVREALQDTRIASLAAVARRPLRHTHPRLRQIIREDFANFRPLEPVLASTDVVICALGLSWYQARNESHYRLITHDYVMACARVAAVANPAIHFCFVSGQGAAANGSQAWARIKGQTEHDLEAVFGSRLIVFRPCRARAAVLGQYRHGAADAVPFDAVAMDYRQPGGCPRRAARRHRGAGSESGCKSRHHRRRGRLRGATPGVGLKMPVPIDPTAGGIPPLR